MKIIHSFVRFSAQPVLLFFLILAVGLLVPARAYAQMEGQPSLQAQPVSLDTVNVDVWPEYDQPSVLVILHVKLSPQVTLPADMSIRIPASAGRPHAVAWLSPDNALFDMKYTTKAAGDWAEIQFNTPSPDIQIEYYNPTIKKTGSRRDFVYRWSEKYPVQNLTLQIQQPVNATNMAFRPDVGSGQTGDFGLKYYSLLVGKVNAGTTFDLAISYDKTDDTLTNPKQFQPAQPNEPVDSSASGRVAFDQFLPWGVGGLGLMLIAAGSFWYWRTGRAPSSARPSSAHPRHSPANTNRTLVPNASTGDVSFCRVNLSRRQKRRTARKPSWRF